MAEKIIKHALFTYDDGSTALRGDTVNITDEQSLRYGEQVGAFATDDDLEDPEFAALVESRKQQGAVSTVPGLNSAASVEVDPATVDGRRSVAGSADPAIQSGLVDPATVDPPRRGRPRKQEG